MENLSGKVAVVTGAGKGIGKAIALALAAEGVHVGLMARTENDVRAVAEEIGQKGVKASYATADVSKREEVEAAVEFAQTSPEPEVEEWEDVLFA